MATRTEGESTVKSCAQYIAECKARFGNPRTSDRELGKRLGELVGSAPFGQSYVAGAKSGKCTDPLAIAIATALGIDAGEVLWAARTERERDPEVRKHLEAWGEAVGKVIAAAPVGVMQQVRDGAAVSWRKRSVAHRPPGRATTARQARPARAFFMPLCRPA
jgi:hypothetical protein